MPMPTKRAAKKKKLSLKPVEKLLLQILVKLESAEKRKGLTKEQASTIEHDIANVKALIAQVQPSCHKEPSYDLGI
jgi:hypothetical protein